MINLLESVQKNLGYPALKKIDPNTQEVALDPTLSPDAKLGQAAIPAVLTFLYKILKTDKGIEELLQKGDSLNFGDFIFKDKKSEVIRRIAAYAAYSQDIAERKVNEIIAEAVKLIKENIADNNSNSNIIALIGSERDHILPYLPATLNIGELIGDTTLDDKTNKMEGPISSLMHKIEKGFSNSQ